MSRLALLLLFLHLFPQQPQTHEIMDGVSALYGRMDSLQADFEQIQKDANRTYALRGHVYLKKGKRARFDYVSRNGQTEQIDQIDYFDGTTHTRYEPLQKQARKQPMGRSDDERLLIFLILGNRESPWKNEFQKIERQASGRMPGNQVLKLTPKNQKSIREITVEVSSSTFLIHRFAFTRTDNSYTEYVFTNIKTTPLDESLFKFKAPPDVEIFER